MATLLKIGYKEQGHTGNLTADANERTLVIEAIFDEATDIDSFLSIDGVPSLGDEYPYNTTLRCESIAPQSTANYKIWRATVKYSASAVTIEDELAYDFIPTAIKRNEATDKAYWINNPTLAEGSQVPRSATPIYPIKLSTGNSPERAPEIVKVNTSYSWWQIETEKVTDGVDDGSIFQYIGTINSKEVVIAGIKFAPYTIELKNYQPEIYFYTEPGQTLASRRYKGYYTIEKHEPDTSVSILDQDLYAILPPSGKPTASESEWVLRRIKLSDLPINSGKITANSDSDKEITEPALLNGAGKLLAADASAIYLKYEVKRAVDFSSVLNLAKKNAYTTDVV